MAQDDKRVDVALTDEATQMKKRARRRLIGAAALALFAAIVLPLVMDHQPATPLKDIQVRIPGPDEGMAQRVSPPVSVASAKPVAKPVIEQKPEQKQENKPEVKEDPKPEPKAEPKQEAKTQPASTTKSAADDEAKRAREALSGKSSGEAWVVQLGAYQNAGSVTNLINKIKQLGIPTYTEKVDTPNGPRTRVRAGPFPSQDAAEKARVRVKIVGVDGPVARKP